MKHVSRLSLLVAALALFGCGGGGSGTTSSSGSPTTSGTSSFTLNIVDGSSTAAKAATAPRALAIATAIPSSANTARVIFRNISTVTTQVPILDEYDQPTGQYTTVTQATEIYKRVVDAAYSSGGSVTVSVPPSPSRGYVVDVLTYYNDGSSNYYMLKYGRSASNIVISSTSTSGTVTVNTIAPTVTSSADPVISQSPYTVAIGNGANPMPLRSYYKIRQDLSDVTFASFAAYSTHLPAGSFGNRAFTAPTTYANGSIYMPAQFFIDDSMLDATKNERYTRWTMIAPVSVGITGLISVTLTP